MSQTQIKRNLDTVIHEVHGLLDSINPETDMHGMQERLKQAVGSAQQKVVNLAGDAKAKTQAAAKATDQYVHERPWQSVGLGAAAGLLIGLLLARR